MSDNILSIPKVSIIIPIYNTAPFLSETLDSICNQSLKELDIILINDGSTDESPNIIEEYVRKDNRIKHLTQPNQGQSVARNNGLQLAKGKYIYFMDSDDILDTDALKKCYNMCEKDELDFVFFDATVISSPNDSNTFAYCRKEIISEDKLWNGIDLFNYELEHNIFIVSPCLCFTSHQFLKSCFSGFPPGIIHEDHAFAVQIRLNAHRIRYISQPYFKRRVRANSTMTNDFSMRNIDGYTTVCARIRNWTQQHPEWGSVINLYLIKTLNSVIWLGHRMTLLEKIETACRFQRMSISQYVTYKNWIVFWFK